MSGCASKAESLDGSSVLSVYSEIADDPTASSVYSEITDDPTASSVYNEINPSQIYNDIITVPTTSINSFTLNTEDSSLTSQYRNRY